MQPVYPFFGNISRRSTRFLIRQPPFQNRFTVVRVQNRVLCFEDWPYEGYTGGMQLVSGTGGVFWSPRKFSESLERFHYFDIFPTRILRYPAIQRSPKFRTEESGVFEVQVCDV